MNAANLVFLSYAHEDHQAAFRLYGDLRKAGLNVWFDRESLLPGQNWEKEVRKAIRGSRYFLALLSSHSVTKRGFVQKEIASALEILTEFPESETFVIPLRLNACVPSHEKLKELHWTDMFPSWENAIKKILAVLLKESRPKTNGKQQPGILNHVADKIKKASRSLRSPNPQVQADAIDILVKYHASDVLIEALGHSRTEVRQAAARGAARLRDPKALPYLVAGLQNIGTSTRKAVIPGVERLISAYGEAAVTALLDAYPEWPGHAEGDRVRTALKLSVDRNSVLKVLSRIRKGKFALFLEAAVTSGVPLRRSDIEPLIREYVKSKTDGSVRASQARRVSLWLPYSSIRNSLWVRNMIIEWIESICTRKTTSFGSICDEIALVENALRIKVLTHDSVRDLARRTPNADLKTALREITQKKQL
ncbi:MAG: toll/interleukin-1 receptor domain-containing protein [Planctomycetota bacterium]|jgi:hypothetical protein